MTVKAIREASIDELEEVPGIGPALAQQIAAALQSEAPAPAVDMATGEILD